jgi:ABC-2 type transport system permease protein
MNLMLPLMRREWLQHRFGWSLLALVPLALALLLLSFGQIEIGDDHAEMRQQLLPLMLAFAAIAGSTLIIFATLAITSLIIVSGLPRRDHGDRSIEFWLSLPIGHAQSLAVPLFVHLVLVPAAALLIGLAGGYILSLVLVTRVVGIGEWFALPWVAIVSATVALVLRLLAGLPLALLWLSPLIMLVVLSTALFRRWGIPILAVGLGLGSFVLERLFGQPMLAAAMGRMAQNGAQALLAANGKGFVIERGEDAAAMLGLLPAWALNDLGAAVAALASPWMVGGLAFAGACFAALVYWRQQGASAGV